MAEFENNQQTTTNSKSSTNNMTSSSLFNRSLTIHSTPVTKPYLQSTSGFFNSFESMKGKVKKLRSLFESPKPNPNELQIQATKKLQSVKSMGPEYNRLPALGFINDSRIRLPGTEDRIVVYLTSLRGIRRTYEDCYAVRMIFRGFRVWIDERDISMDSAYKKELQSVLGEKNASLPQVFIRGNHVGGAEVIKQMFETGEMAMGCGDVRFVPCGNCSGSRKLFDEDEGVLKRCLECNENGLIRCPDCCS
ncbi:GLUTAREDOXIN DOMAIN-CONTAINING CYSTEINE-RICH PROTEIN CG12206-RELATED [Salix purpurea]|uniref:GLUTAREDOXIN DOMAIN-CONTAINING CYSTEINE-RICH PROTEIN CG12206-RELATED n=1 Tax=Salix purpurea TaxID=77065 RepID=A0A9Q0QDX7_SALPP|nr:GLUTAREDOXIN DOMAIN-CONTAINING CYSTEINE-RICH PROTEIN CG12206-RELATED [Salix purpurea]